MSEKPKEFVLDDQTKKYIKFGIIGVVVFILVIILISVIVPKLSGKTASTSSTPAPTPAPAPSKTGAGTAGAGGSTTPPAPSKPSTPSKPASSQPASSQPSSSQPTTIPPATPSSATIPPATPSSATIPPATPSSATPTATSPTGPTSVGDNCYLYVTGISNGLLQFSSDNPINGFTLGNYSGDGPKTNITPNKPGMYEIACSGGVVGNGSSIICTLNNVNVRMYNVFAQSESRNGLAYMMNWTQQCASYNNSSQAGFQIQLTNASLWTGGLPLWVSIKYIGKVGELDNCNLFASGIRNSGMLQFSNYSSNNPINGFTLGNNNGSGPNTVIIPNKPGIYEVTCSGAFIGKGNSIFAKLNNLNVRMYDVFTQSESKNDIAYMMNWTQQCAPYSNLTLAGFEIQLTNATLWDGMPLWVSIKYISPINNNIHIPKSLSLYYTGNCNLYSTVMLNGGMLQFSNYSSNNPINGFTLGNNNGSGPNTVIIPNKPGIYEVTCSGALKGNGSSIFGTLNNLNVRMYNVFFQSESNNDEKYMMNFTAHAIPYSNLTLAGFQIQLTNATLWSDMPLWVFVRYLGL